MTSRGVRSSKITTASTHSSAARISARSLFWNQRAACAFQLAHAGVAIHADDERVAEIAGLLEAANVAGMQHVEAAVGENDAASVAFLAAKPQNRFVQSEYRRTDSKDLHAGIAANETDA